MRGGVGWPPFPQVKEILDMEMIIPLLIGTSAMVTQMGVHVASSWLPPGTGALPTSCVGPFQKTGGFSIKDFYHIEPKLLDFHFCVNSVLQNGLFTLPCDNLKMEALII